MGDSGHYFLFTKFFEIFYMFKTFCMVALDSFMTFSPNLSKFSGRGGRRVNIYLAFLKNLYEFSSPLFMGSCKICQLSVMGNLTNQN